MMSRRLCKDDVRKNNEGSIIAELLVAVALCSVFAVIIGTSSSHVREIYTRSTESLAKMADQESFVFGNEVKYGNVRIESIYGPLSLRKVSRKQTNVNGNSLCASYFDQNTSPILNAAKDNASIEDVSIEARQIRLPIDPLLPLTDLEVRNNIAYISADSSVSSDPDLLVVDLSETGEPKLISALNTGPGLSAIALVGRHVFAAANSSAYQLHVIEMDDTRNLQLKTRFALHAPNASSSLPTGSAIAYENGRIILGTSKWDGDELAVIDVSNRLLPSVMGGQAIGSKVTDIRVENERVFVATAGQNQFLMFDLDQSSGNLSQVWNFSPSGWQRQEGKVSAIFEDELYLGRTSGGYDISDDHEVFGWNYSVPHPTSSAKSLNVERGVYGIITDRNYVYFASRKYDSEFTVVHKDYSLGSFSSQKSFSLPIGPEVMTCDRDRMYILAHLAPYIYEIKIKK